VTRFVLLDAGVIGLHCSSPRLAEVAACLAWMARMIAARTVVAIPDVTDYEVRRELTRLGAKAKLTRLDSLRTGLRSIEVSPPAWLQAAEFWAIVRRAGRPTADPQALDGDAILAGIAATFGAPGDLVTIATTNVGHLARFPGIDARRWESIA
jgi:predicted nucleic acid-binding protein